MRPQRPERRCQSDDLSHFLRPPLGGGACQDTAKAMADELNRSPGIATCRVHSLHKHFQQDVRAVSVTPNVGEARFIAYTMKPKTELGKVQV